MAALFERDARTLGLRAGQLSREGLSPEPTRFVDYKKEAGLSRNRPLPHALADCTSAALVQATGLSALDTPAFRFIGLPVIADAVGITASTLKAHKRQPDFPRYCLKQVGWLTVTDIDGITTIKNWLEPRRDGNAMRRRRNSNSRLRVG